MAPRSLFPEQSVNRAGGGDSHEHAFGIGKTVPHPSGHSSAANKDGTRRARGDQFVAVHRQVLGGQQAGIFEEVARIPMIGFRPRGILDHLAIITAIDFCAALP